MISRTHWSASRRSITVAAVVMAGLAAIEVGAVPAVGAEDKVQVTGESLPAASPGLDTTAAGTVVPELRVRGRRAEQSSILHDGQAHALLFVGRRGAVSRRQTAALRKWFAQGFTLPQGVVYSTIWVGGLSPGGPTPQWQRSWPTPTLRDSARRVAATAYGTGRLPVWAFVDRSGALLARYSGYLGIEDLAELLYRFGMIPRPGASSPVQS